MNFLGKKTTNERTCLLLYVCPINIYFFSFDFHLNTEHIFMDFHFFFRLFVLFVGFCCRLDFIKMHNWWIFTIFGLVFKSFSMVHVKVCTVCMHCAVHVKLWFIADVLIYRWNLSLWKGREKKSCSTVKRKIQNSSNWTNRWTEWNTNTTKKKDRRKEEEGLLFYRFLYRECAFSERFTMTLHSNFFLCHCNVCVFFLVELHNNSCNAHEYYKLYNCIELNSTQLKNIPTKKTVVILRVNFT